MTITKTYEIRGAGVELFSAREPEVLYVGPSNCGKTFNLCQYSLWICEFFPGARILWVREKRTAMTDSVLLTFEAEVLPGGRNHPACVGTAGRDNRWHYVWPYAKKTVQGKTYEGESEIVVSGLSDPEDLYSTMYDVVIVFEARQVKFEVYQKLFRCLRHKHIPWRQIVSDTNPARYKHWLHERAKRGHMRWIRAQHSDNPAFNPGDQGMLDRLQGADRAQLRDGLWTDDSEQILPQFEWDIHVIKATCSKDIHGRWWITPARQGQACGDDRIKVEYFVGGLDFGFRKPGCLGCWAVDADGRMYRVAEYYRTEKTIDWWAERVEALYLEFGIRRIYCDHDPGDIKKINYRIGSRQGRSAPAIAVEAVKDYMAGINLLRDLLVVDKSMKPAIFWLEGTLRDRQASLAELNKPTCSEEEIGEYVHASDTDHDKLKEEPSKFCEDHGLDQTRYAAMGVHGRQHAQKDKPKQYPPGSYGELYGDAANPKKIKI